jgi:ketosteroid isomerase-like protein
MASDTSAPAAALERLQRAIIRHDLEALVACFTPDYVNETPLHPARSFNGREQVARNWQRIFAAVPQLSAEVLRCVVDRDSVWAEWEMSGRRVDGGRLLMRGVTLLGVRDGLIAWARFYLDPVEKGGVGAEAATSAVLAS